MTMATLEDIAGNDDLEDEDVDDEDDNEDELGDHEDADDEDDEVGGGGDEGDPDGEPKTPVVPVSGFEQLRTLLADPEISSTLQEQIAEYQARLRAEADTAAEAEAFQKLIQDGDLEGVGKIVVERMQTDAVKGQVRDAVTKEMFTPVYTELFAQPELQTLTAEDREKLNIDNFASPAAHVAAIGTFIAQKRFDAAVAAKVKEGVAEALAAEKNKAASEKVKAPSLAGRSPAPMGVIQPKVTSADLIREGLRGIIGIKPDDDDE